MTGKRKFTVTLVVSVLAHDEDSAIDIAAEAIKMAGSAAADCSVEAAE